MDRQNVKPNRPSLLANSDASAADRAPAAGRILADVEQGRSRTPSARALRRGPLLAMLGVALLALCGVFAWGAFDGASTADDAAQAPALSAESPTSPDTADGMRAPDPAPASATADTATIVDGDNPFGGKAVPATPGPNPFGENANPQRTAKRANPFTDTHASEKRIAAPAKRAVAPIGTTATASARTRPPAKVATPVAIKAKSEGDETALGNSLLSNIVTADALPTSPARAPAVLASPAAQGAASAVASGVPAAATRPESKVIRPQTGADHEVLDALIQQVDAAGASGPSSGPVGNLPARVDPIGVGEPLASAEKLQRDLRRCPKANTTAGIDCRIKACRDHGGKNAACAVKH